MPLIDDRPEALDPLAAPRDARRSLALRIAHRNRLRELRAERLARLRPAATPAAVATASASADDDDAAGALEDFLRALTGSVLTRPAPDPRLAPAAAAVLPFQRAVAAPAPRAPEGDLALLPGIGPGLVWALRRAGLARLADLAPLEAAELAARLGPLGRLVPAAAWITRARAATGG